MATEFDRQASELVTEAARLPTEKRALFLLAYAQRFAKLFGLFEDRVAKLTTRFDDVLRKIWAVAGGRSSPNALPRELDSLIPGEEWVVDGFYDSLAQDIGALADGALEGLVDRDGIQRRPESAVFDALRHILCEMRLGCLEPGGYDPEGQEFERTLHQEPIIKDEVRVWRLLIDKVAAGTSVDELRDYALANMFDPAALEPDLSNGLAKDQESAKQ